MCKKQMDLTLKMFDAEGRLITDDNYPVFVDWSNDFAKDTAGQAETIYVMKQFIALAELAGEKDIESYRAALGRMERYAREKFYDSSRKLFVADDSGAFPSEGHSDTIHVSLHS